jgi:hypothetical protein
MNEFGDIIFALTWLAGVGAPYLVGKLFAYIAENFPKWHELRREVKFLIPMIVSILLSMGAILLMGQTEIVETLGPIWSMISSAVIMYYGSQIGYREIKTTDYGKSARLEAKG